MRAAAACERTCIHFTDDVWIERESVHISQKHGILPYIISFCFCICFLLSFVQQVDLFFFHLVCSLIGCALLSAAFTGESMAFQLTRNGGKSKRPSH